MVLNVQIKSFEDQNVTLLRVQGLVVLFIHWKLLKTKKKNGAPDIFSLVKTKNKNWILLYEWYLGDWSEVRWYNVYKED